MNRFVPLNIIQAPASHGYMTTASQIAWCAVGDFQGLSYVKCNPASLTCKSSENGAGGTTLTLTELAVDVTVKLGEGCVTLLALLKSITGTALNFDSLAHSSILP